MAEESETPRHPTIFDRVFKPETGCRLYHYCSTPTFLSVLQNGALRFSDVNMMNDGEEGRYGYTLFEQAANELLKLAKDQVSLDGLGPDFFDQVDSYLSPKQLHSHPVVACFSKAPDVLSQWRAYAQDAQGWAIGFAGDAIDLMPVTVLDVLYEPSEQLEEVRNSLAAMYFLWRKDGGEFETAIGDSARLLASLMLAYKHPSFGEEQEVRALHELSVSFGNDGWLLSDEGGTASGIAVEGQSVKFRADGASVVAYVDLPLERANGVMIPEVWLGPRNSNGTGNAIFPLTHFGHRNVELHRSASTYRG